MANSTSSTTQIDENVETGVAISYVATMFDSVDEAKAAYKVLREVAREGLVDIIDAAYVEKTDRSKIKIHDHNDWIVGEGILAGGVAGAIIGIVAGAILLPAAIGALIGGVVTGVYEHDVSFTNKELKKLADSLPVGTSALIAIVEDEYVEQVEIEMGKQSGKKVHSGTVPKSTTDSLMQSKKAAKSSS